LTRQTSKPVTVLIVANIVPENMLARVFLVITRQPQ